MANAVRTNAAQTMSVRQRLLSVAKQLADEGAHYLWGGDGEIPSAQNLSLFAPTVLSFDTNTNLAFCAAWKKVENKPFVCSGRCLAVANGHNFLVPFPEQDPRLAAFIARYASASQTNWGTELTPRKVLGSGAGEPVNYNVKPPIHLNGQVVFGEGCDDTKHFDCYGFVNWIVQQVCGVTITRGTSIPLLKNPSGDPIGTYLAPNDPGLPADLLIYPGHIAFAIGSPATSDSSVTYWLAQAEASIYGVTHGKPRSDTPTQRVRLSDSTLLNKH